MGTYYVLKRKTYSNQYYNYDETDRLKQMKDSDILAERKKKAPGMGNVITSAAGGAAVGALGLGIRGGLKKGTTFRKGAGKGAVLGAAVAGGIALAKRAKQTEANSFYNDRLEYAQRQAARREKKDWKQNMTQRDGYSY